MGTKSLAEGTATTETTELAEARALAHAAEDKVKAKDAELEAMAKSLAEAHETLRIAQANELTKVAPAAETSTQLARGVEAEGLVRETAALQLASTEESLASKTS